jgi:hypothetical protein
VRAIVSLLSLALLAPMPAVAAPAAAPFADPPVACIYHTYRNKDWPPLVKLVRSGMNPADNGERVMLGNIQAAAEVCRKRYGWGKKRQDAALRYFVGRVLATDSTYHLKKFGLDYEKLEALVAALDPGTRQAYVAGNVSNDQSAATLAALKTLGIDFAAVPAEERALFGQKLSQGVLGLVVEHEGEAAFDA